MGGYVPVSTGMYVFKLKCMVYRMVALAWHRFGWYIWII
jgi:hypothetical protein